MFRIFLESSKRNKNPTQFNPPYSVFLTFIGSCFGELNYLRVSKVKFLLLHLIQSTNFHPHDYYNLKVWGALKFAYIKQDNLNSRVVKFVFIIYHEDVKGYKLWEMEPR